MTSRTYKEDRETISFPHLLHSVNSKTLALSFSLFHFSFFLLRLDPWYLLIDIQLLLGRVSKFDSRESISDPIMLWIACILLEIQNKIQNLTSFSRFWIRNYCYLYCGYVLDFIPWLDEPRNKIGNFQILERERELGNGNGLQDGRNFCPSKSERSLWGTVRFQRFHRSRNQNRVSETCSQVCLISSNFSFFS